ncbi:MAG: hypothetical protein QGD94_11875, partial [Planctomycetia bacterium]|nr:hypothetical protein [Planctomycetia bacterium]
HHNTVVCTDWPAAIIRGRPQQPSEIHHNWFISHKRGWATENIGWCVMQPGGKGNLKVYKNHYGPKAPPGYPQSVQKQVDAIIKAKQEGKDRHRLAKGDWTNVED